MTGQTSASERCGSSRLATACFCAKTLENSANIRHNGSKSPWVGTFCSPHAPPSCDSTRTCRSQRGDPQRDQLGQRLALERGIIERHRRASTIVTSNRAIEEWIPLFDDPILAQSALDRLAHNGHQVVMDGPSYRSRQRPGQKADPAPPKRRK
jgi:hypothetical protein